MLEEQVLLPTEPPSPSPGEEASFWSLSGTGQYCQHYPLELKSSYPVEGAPPTANMVGSTTGQVGDL